MSRKGKFIIISVIVLIIILGFLSYSYYLKYRAPYYHGFARNDTCEHPVETESDKLQESQNLLKETMKIFTTTYTETCGDLGYGYTDCDIKIYSPQDKEIFHKTIKYCGLISNITTDIKGNFYFYDHRQWSPFQNTMLYKYDRTKEELLSSLLRPSLPIWQSGSPTWTAYCGTVVQGYSGSHRGLYYNKEREVLWIAYLRPTSYTKGRKTCDLQLMEFKDLDGFKNQNLSILDSQKTFDAIVSDSETKKIIRFISDFKIEVINADEFFVFWQEASNSYRPLSRTNFRQKINILTHQITEKEEILAMPE